MNRRITLIQLLLLVGIATAVADCKLSDTAIRNKLLGYWLSPRHGYHIASKEITYMCPRKYATTTNHWAVKDGKFYWVLSRMSMTTLVGIAEMGPCNF
jgi:hypothetical protein